MKINNSFYFNFTLQLRPNRWFSLVNRFLFLPFILFTNLLFAQENNTINGVVSSEKGEFLNGVTIQLNKQITIGQTNKDGFFSIINIPSKANLTFSRIGYKTYSLDLDLESLKEYSFNIILIPDIKSLEEVYITEKYRSNDINNIDFVKYSAFPQSSGSIESFIKNLPGVSGNNELSSQYSVRGGTFDENLIYLNDVEIYRPMLIRSGQQEGLGFINPSLTSNVHFSAGGFEARYGDKLSSVLDVKYHMPDSLTIEAQAGLLLSTATIKLPNKNGFILAGFRSKNNGNLLEKQNLKGQYYSRFSDYQFLLNHNISNKINFSVLGLYNQGRLAIEPESRTTEFGTSDDVLRLFVNYSGREMSEFEAINTAFTLSYNPSNKFNMKWISSIARINEREDANLLGWYSFIDNVGSGLNSPIRQDLLGAGSNQTFFKNELSTLIYNSELKIFKQIKNSFLEMGARFQTDIINDNLNEFDARDTSAYSYPESGNWEYSGIVKEINRIKIARFNTFIQNTFTLGLKVNVIAGIRFNYNNYSNEIMISPRLSLMYGSLQNDKIQFKFSVGSYNQAPFYRELKNYNGSLNLNARAQKSFHFITGTDYIFDGLGTRLKFSSEIYYKLLSRITPYKIEDLQIRYLSDKRARAYAAGVDFSLNGKFAKDLESTVRLSIMKTEEDIMDDSYLSKDNLGNNIRIYPGYLRRPSDQLFNVSMMFQDRLIQNPTYKVHLNLIYSSSLPVGPKGPERYTDQFKIPSYKRVDIGFSKDFADKDSKNGSPFIKKHFQLLSLHSEIFNLFNFKNTVSYLWLNDKNDNQYAIPNYLSSRMFNLRLIATLKTR
jgi:hypothetical protein